MKSRPLSLLIVAGVLIVLAIVFGYKSIANMQVINNATATAVCTGTDSTVGEQAFPSECIGSSIEWYDVVFFVVFCSTSTFLLSWVLLEGSRKSKELKTPILMLITIATIALSIIFGDKDVRAIQSIQSTTTMKWSDFIFFVSSCSISVALLLWLIFFSKTKQNLTSKGGSK